MNHQPSLLQSSSASDRPPVSNAGDMSGGLPTDQDAVEVILIDDDPAILHTTSLLLTEAGLKVQMFSDPLDALMWAADTEPTCILVDLKLPGIEGLDLVAGFCALRRHVVILVSGYVDVATTVDAMRLGVDNVLPKPVSETTLLAAIRHGRAVLATLVQDDILTFTRRERQVGELIVRGQTTKQIAQTLSLSPRTVEFFRASLLRKTQSPNTAALAVALTRLGFHSED